MQCEMVVGSYEGSIKGFSFDLFQPKKGLVATFTEDALTCVVKCIASSGRYLAIGGYDSTIKVYDMRKRSEVGTLLHHSDTVTGLSFHDDTHLFSASEDGSIALWKTGSWECLKTLKGHKGSVHCVAVHPSGKLAVSVSKDRTLRTWDLIRARLAFVINLRAVAHLVCWDTAGSHYAVAMQDTVHLYSVETGAVETVVETGKRVNTMLYLQEDILAVGSDKKVVELYSTSTGTLLHSLTGHEKRVKSLCVSPGSGYLFSLSSDEVLKVWKLPEGCKNLTSITCVSEVSTACVPVCMAVVTPPTLECRIGGRKVKREKEEERLEGGLTVKSLSKKSEVKSKRHFLAVQRTKKTFSKRRHFSRKVLLRHKNWYW